MGVRAPIVRSVLVACVIASLAVPAGATGRSDLFAPIDRVSLPGLGARSLVLEPNPLLSPRARFTVTGANGAAVPVAPPLVSTWRGSVSGDPSSVVRLTLAPAFTSGSIVTGGETFVTDGGAWRPVRDGADRARAGSVDLAAGDDHVPSHPIGIGVLNCSLMPCGELTAQIVLDADVFFREQRPATCFARQLAALNQIDGIFDQQAIDVRFKVTQQNCRTAADLGERGTDIAPYHEAFQRWWGEQGSDRSLVHLFTGYDFQGRTLGRTYSPALCARVQPDPLVKGPPEQRCPFGYSLSQSVPDAEGEYRATTFHAAKLLANVFGYAFGGSADAAEGCGPERTGTILCSPIQWNGPNVFSEANERRLRAQAEQKLGYLVRTP